MKQPDKLQTNTQNQRLYFLIFHGKYFGKNEYKVKKQFSYPCLYTCINTVNIGFLVLSVYPSFSAIISCPVTKEMGWNTHYYPSHV